jgi:hypothetical protein
MLDVDAASSHRRVGKIAAALRPTATAASQPDQLVDVVVTPSLLEFRDGSPVDDASAWPRRRRDLGHVLWSEYGGLPPQPLRIDVVRRAEGGIRAWDDALPGVRHRVVEVTAHFPGGASLPLTVSLWIPPGDGPFPVLLDCDGCWRYFSDDVVRRVLERGNIAASVDRTQAAADNKDAYRSTGLYRIFPGERGKTNAGSCAVLCCKTVLCQDRPSNQIQN